MAQPGPTCSWWRPWSTVSEFSYDDAPPWPPAADGGGFSLVLISPRSHPDPNLAGNWRASGSVGGSPARPDGLTLESWMAAHGITGDLTADPDADGLGHLLEYALGGNPHQPESIPPVALVRDQAGIISVTIRRRAGVDNVQIMAQSSLDLTTWSVGRLQLIDVKPDPATPGVEILTLRPTPEPGLPLFVRIAVQR
ncbi:MAG: hypothetical protein ACKV19_08425 [Verrucomicrobiales bacterium]